MHVIIGYGAVSLGFAGALLGVVTSAYSLITKRPELMRAVRLHVALVLVAVLVAAYEVGAFGGASDGVDVHDCLVSALVGLDETIFLE